MAVNLQKGQKVDLRKPDGSGLKHVMIGLGWDAAKRSAGLFGSLFGNSIGGGRFGNVLNSRFRSRFGNGF